MTETMEFDQFSYSYMEKWHGNMLHVQTILSINNGDFFPIGNCLKTNGEKFRAGMAQEDEFWSPERELGILRSDLAPVCGI